ncbi:hypothetical protein [Phenylobacterium sp.]|uniref:hypothetical protein n=1 Tax=Phenylobacterium sp. TaxID=1871053 RepID=UPI002FDF1839
MTAVYALATILLLFVAATCVFGLVKGGAPERFAAGLILANLLVGVLNGWVIDHQPLLSLVNNGLTALLLLPLTVYYASFWLGGVMLLYGLLFTLHAYYTVVARPYDELFANLNNLNFFAVSLCLLSGTVIAWRRRRRAAAGG